ncbi:MAG: hypothetical protein NC102_03610 [Clostridium sp.]|nr:hypothetical protein [Clostridium sp.]
MSAAAIISGLLLWRAFPPLWEESMEEKHYRWLQKACAAIGCAIVLGGILYGFFR